MCTPSPSWHDCCRHRRRSFFNTHVKTFIYYFYVGCVCVCVWRSAFKYIVMRCHLRITTTFFFLFSGENISFFFFWRILYANMRWNERRKKNTGAQSFTMCILHVAAIVLLLLQLLLFHNSIQFLSLCHSKFHLSSSFEQFLTHGDRSPRATFTLFIYIFFVLLLSIHEKWLLNIFINRFVPLRIMSSISTALLSSMKKGFYFCYYIQEMYIKVAK